MTTRLTFLVLLVVQLFISCENNKGKVIVKDVTLEEIVQEEPEPPSSFSCINPMTLKEWFYKICDTEKSEYLDINFNLLIFETDNCYGIGLKNVTKTTLDSSPTIANPKTEFEYSAVSKTSYKGLNLTQVIKKIESQLTEFSETPEFKLSPIAKANHITIKFNDKTTINLK